MTSCHPVGAVVGFTHASSVTALVRWRDAASFITTWAFVPLKDRAPPYLPLVVQVALTIVPVLPFPETSLTVVPDPALKSYAATSPGVPVEALVVAVAVFENALRFPAASVAST